MNFNLKTIAASTVALSACLGSAGAAQAATFNNVFFDFWHTPYASGYQAPSINLASSTNPTISLTATANSGNVYIQEGPNVSDGFGLGVKNGSSDNTQIDGSSPAEQLYLSFDSTKWVATLLSVTFSRIGTNDEGAITVNGNVLWSGDLPGGNSSDSDIQSKSFTSYAAASRTGNTFGFGTVNSDDDYYVKYAYFNITEVPQNVPEPLTILGTLAAATLGVGMKRKLAVKA